MRYYMQIWCKRGSFWPMILSLGKKSKRGQKRTTKERYPPHTAFPLQFRPRVLQTERSHDRQKWELGRGELTFRKKAGAPPVLRSEVMLRPSNMVACIVPCNKIGSIAADFLHTFIILVSPAHQCIMYHHRGLQP